MTEALYLAEDLRSLGQELARPECVLTTADGTIYVSDWRGGVTAILSNGHQQQFLAKNPEVDIRPNGIALQQDGSFLLANLGDEGGIWQLTRRGKLTPIVTELEGRIIPPSNYVMLDPQGRIWFTVSTQQTPRAAAYRSDIADGYIAVMDQRGARIVADHLCYTNEVQVHPSGNWLYVNETFARRTSRMRIYDGARLGKRETVAEYGHGMYPDGLYFDEDGGFWVVSIVSNRVVRVSPNGKQQLLLQDVDPVWLQEVETAFVDHDMGRQHLDQVRSEHLKSVSSIAFGASNRRLCILGCLLGSELKCFRSPYVGVEPVHWNWCY